MSGGGSQTSTSQTTVPPQFLSAYTNTVNRATNVASKPYQAYSGPLVAGFSGQQQQAQNEVSNLQGSYQPELGAAQSAINASQTPLWGGVQQFSPNTIANYENPYQSQVVNATEGQIANTDAQQQTQLAGNAASAGAFGGDRMGVAQGILGGQQALANNSTLAGLNQSNYTQALGEFNQQQGAQLGANEANSWLNSQAGYADANLASEGNNLGLTDASALASSGLTQQQQAQAGLNTNYEQWEAQQAFPYQQTGWLANITEGIGSNVGGTSTTTQTNNADGGRVPRQTGGIVPHATGMRPHFDGGGGILSDIPDPAVSYIPSISGGGGGDIGKGPPQAPQVQAQQNPLGNPATDIGAATGAVSLYNNLGLGSLFGSGQTTMSAPTTTQIGSGLVGNGWTLDAPAGLASAGAQVPTTTEIGSGLVGNGWALDAPAATAANPGFLGGLGSAVEAGAADVGSGIASAAGAVGDAAAAGAGAIGDGLAAAGSWLLGLLALKDGGAVEEPQHKAGGGIVIPFPQHRASGGTTGNMGEMPYSMEPPLLANGTTGAGAPMSYMPGSSGAAFTSPGGIATGNTSAPFISNSGVGISTNPFGVNGTPNMNLKHGGIVIPFRRHFDDGGTLDQNDFGGAGVADPDASATPAQGIAPAASTATTTTTPDASYTPEKPNLWLPALAAVATSALGHHHDNSHNIAEGVLAGLGTYSSEDNRYQEGEQKAATIQQEAKRLADQAQQHRDEIALENKRADATEQYQAGMLNNDQARTTMEGQHYAASEGIENKRLGIESAGEQSLANYRDHMFTGQGTPVGTDDAGGMIFANSKGNGMTDEMGNAYQGPVHPLPAVAARVQQQQYATDTRAKIAAANIDQKEKDRLLRMNDADLSNAVRLNGQSMFALGAEKTTPQQSLDTVRNMRGTLPNPNVSGDGTLGPLGDPRLKNQTLQSGPAQPQAPAVPAGLPPTARQLPDGSGWAVPDGKGGWMRAVQSGGNG